MWDTAGQERFRTITQTYFRGTQGVILAYNPSNRDSLDNIHSWMKLVDENCPCGINKILVGIRENKESKLAVEKFYIEAIRKQYNCKHF